MVCFDLMPLVPELLPDVVDLDQRCLGGLWRIDGYQREMASSNSDLLMIRAANLTSAEEQISTPPPRLPPVLAFGCSWAVLEEAHITLLAVHPDYQRRGLGQAMLWAMLQTAHDRGLHYATLEVKDSNHPAIALYQQFGFQEAGRRRRYYPTGEDALILWRSGLHEPKFITSLATWRQQICDRLTQQDWHLSIQLQQKQ